MNAQLNGLIVTKESPNYETCCLSWNRAIDKHPSMIIYCQQTEDVVFAIHYVRETTPFSRAIRNSSLCRIFNGRWSSGNRCKSNG